MPTTNILCLTFMAQLALLASGTSFAQAPVRLDYRRGEGAEQCPDEQAIRNAVAVRLGYNAFRAEAPRSVIAVISRVGQRFTATISLRDASGAIVGEREVASAQADCVELTEAMVLALSIAIDPLGRAREPVEAPEPPSAPPRAQQTQPAEPSLEREQSWPSIQAGLGLFASMGAQAHPSLGASVEARLRSSFLSLGLEGGAQLPTSVAASGGTVSTWLLAVSAVPCLHRGSFGGCALLSLGALRAVPHDLPGAESVTAASFAAGGRIFWELPWVEVLRVRLFLDLVAPLARSTISLDGQAIWRSPPVAGAAGAAATIGF